MMIAFETIFSDHTFRGDLKINLILCQSDGQKTPHLFAFTGKKLNVNAMIPIPVRKSDVRIYPPDHLQTEEHVRLFALLLTVYGLFQYPPTGFCNRDDLLIHDHGDTMFTTAPMPLESALEHMKSVSREAVYYSPRFEQVQACLTGEQDVPDDAHFRHEVQTLKKQKRPTFGTLEMALKAVLPMLSHMPLPPIVR